MARAKRLAGLRLEMAEAFGKVRTEMVDRLGTINETLGFLRIRRDHSVSVARWTIRRNERETPENKRPDTGCRVVTACVSGEGGIRTPETGFPV